MIFGFAKSGPEGWVWAKRQKIAENVCFEAKSDRFRRKEAGYGKTAIFS